MDAIGKQCGAKQWLLDNLKRLRHFRGHGVHSPYVYNIVRQVFMHHGLIECDNFDIYDKLRDRIDLKVATELQNIATICKYANCAIDPTEINERYDFIICTEQYPLEMVQKGVERAYESGATIALMHSKERKEVEQRVVNTHCSTTINRVGYLLIFNNHLPKQRFTL